MTNLVAPSALTEFPDAECNRHPEIVIQQDGAPAHIHPRDAEWMQHLTDMGLEDEMKLVTQPANSPDLNVNDLGFFNALQSMHHCTTPRNEVELVAMAEKTFAEYPTNKINRIWLTLQGVMNNMLDDFGGNQHPLPRMNKEKHEREGRLPVVLPVETSAVYYLEDE